MRVVVQCCGNPEPQNPKGKTHKRNQISEIRSNVTNDALDHVSANMQKFNILPIRHHKVVITSSPQLCIPEIARLQFCHFDILFVYFPKFVRIGISLVSQPSDFQSIPSDHCYREARMKGRHMSLTLTPHTARHTTDTAQTKQSNTTKCIICVTMHRYNNRWIIIIQ